MRINGVNGYVDVEVVETGHIQVSVTENGLVAAVRLTDTGAAALSSLLDTGGLELAAREEAKGEETKKGAS